jgi:hypothetical protein
MSRTTRLIVALGVVLVLVLWYLFVWSPRVEALELVEADIQTTQASQASARARIGELQLVREQAPALQAELAAAASLMPRDTALPGALRQLQQAADDSGATLVSVSPARPEPVVGADDAATNLYALGLALELRGSYFQIVDTLRRLEDPAISPRGFVWESVTLTLDEHPTLTVAVTGRMFSVLTAPPMEPDPNAAVAPTEEATDTEAPPADDASGDAPSADVAEN